MSPTLIIVLLVIYFASILIISRLTARGADSQTFFIADRSSKWYLVAFGMIGTSLSGVTFISVPGDVGAKGFGYFQVVLGYMLGYLIIAFVLLPLYYKLNLISIYTYLQKRFGEAGYKTGAGFFLLSRIVGASFRLYLVAMVLQELIFEQLGVPFFATIAVAITLIYLYTFQGGIKTVVWTDVIQTAFMLASLFISMWFLADQIEGSWIERVSESAYSQIFFWEGSNHFFNQFLSGVAIAVVMTGLDQDMMQKNLTCKNLKEGQTNVISYGVALVIVNFLFLVLGAMLFLFMEDKGLAIPEATDRLFPYISKNHLPLVGGITFVLGVIAASYSSADSALTSMTTSFSIDFLKLNDQKIEEKERNKKRMIVHAVFSLILLFAAYVFSLLANESVIRSLLKAAGYTYGPLLGLFAFGMYTKIPVRDKLIPFIAVASVLLSYLLNEFSPVIFGGYQIGYEILIINGAITFLGLLLIRGGKPVTE